MDVRKFFIGSFALVVLILIYMMFAGTGGSSKKKSSKAESLTMLLSGGSAGAGGDTEGRRGRRVNNDKSIFDSDFGSAGLNNSYSEEEAGATNSKGEVIPINPQTGKPYDEETMEQFEKLSLIFPENNLIPKRMTKEQKAAKDKEDLDFANATAAVSANTANRDQVKIFYERQEKTVKDRIEIIEYLIDAQKEDGEIDKDGQFQKIMDGAKEQLKQIESSKDEAFKKYGL